MCTRVERGEEGISILRTLEKGQIDRNSRDGDRDGEERGLGQPGDEGHQKARQTSRGLRGWE